MTLQDTAPLDPVTVEIITQRLADITAETADTLERVGGTVNTAQMKDYITAIYRGDGSLIATAAPAFVHVYCAGRAVREVIARFGSSIKAGDMFILNDPYIAAIHQSDLYLISPILYEDELVGWSATFVHVMDIGAMSPGGNSPYAREVEQEGLRFGALRLVEDGVLRTDIVNLLAGMTRQPEMLGLDLRSQMAANFTSRDRVRQLHERYGAELVRAVCQHNIDTTRRILEARIAEMPDGTVEESLIIPIGKDENVTFACTLNKQGSELEFDFTRSSPQASVGVNLPLQATFGNCADAVLKTVARDLGKNEGLFGPIKAKTTPGSVLSVTYPAPTSLSTTSGGAAARSLCRSIVSRLISTSDRWRHTANASGLGHRSVRHAGVSQYDSYYVSVLSPADGSGSTLRRDGADCSSGTATHNVEWLEEHFPLLQLYRRYRISNRGGAGTTRGGLGEESAYILRGAPTGELRMVAYGTLGALGSHGLFGGHPGTAGHLQVYNSQAIPWADSTAHFTCSGDPSTLLYEDFVLGPDDVLILQSGTGPGVGDPLFRPPSEVLGDVRKGRLFIDEAEKDYGVVITDGVVDSAATVRVREKIRDFRHELATAAGWDGERLPEILVGEQCDPEAGKCMAVMRASSDPRSLGFPTVIQTAGALGWKWNTGYGEPSFELTYCPLCWSLVDCQYKS